MPHSTCSALHRFMIRRDLPEILAIEREAFDAPWEEKYFIETLSQRQNIGMVLECDARVVAYMVYTLYRQRIHLANLAVAADCRGRGHGTQLLEVVKRKMAARESRRRTLSLEIRETNVAAQVWFRGQRFRCVEVLRDWYDHTEEDAYRFVWQVPGARSQEPGISDPPSRA